jgi:GAF domain-containing protein/HAMP domain-containing protein
MSQKEKIMTTPSSHEATPLEASSLKNHRITALRRVALILGVLMTIGGLGFGIIFIQTQAWQGLGLALMLWANAALFFVARNWAHQGHLNRAVVWMMGSYVINFSLSELLWQGATVLFVVGALVFITIIAGAGLPRRQMIWGGVVGLLTAGLVLLVNWTTPLPRLDSAQVGLLGTLIPMVVGIALLIFLWQTIRALRIGNIRTRLLVAFVSLVLVTAIVISGVSTVINFLDQRQRVFDQLAGVAASKESEITAWIEGLKTDLAVLQIQQDVLLRMRSRLLFFVSDISLLQNSLEQDFANMIKVTGRFDEIFLINLEGQVVASTDEEQHGKILNQETFFQKGLQGLYIQPPIYAPGSNQTSIIIVEPVFNQDGKEVLGVLAGRVEVNRLNQILTQRTGLGDTGETYLVDQNGLLLTASRFSGYAPGIPVQTLGVNRAMETQTRGSALYNDYRAVPVVGVYDWLPDLQVAFLAEQDQAEAFQPIYQGLIRDVSIGLGAIIVAIVIGLWITQSIANPLSKLANIAAQISAGNLELKADVSRRDEIGNLAQAFNSMTTQLRELIGGLEARVQERTRALEAGALISRQITTILDIDELLEQVVNSIQTSFRYYHVHIYLLDEQTQVLVMREGSGEIGRELKARSHKISRGLGIVGSVAERGQPVLAQDVSQVPNFVRNPLLPKIQAELAVPLRKGGATLGVLDIQSEEVGDFTEEDLTLMQSIADQIAVAVDNAHLFRRMQSTAAEAEELNRWITRQTWEDIGRKVQSTGYVFTQAGVSPAQTEWLPTMEKAVYQKTIVQHTPHNGRQAAEATTSVAVPLTLRGEVIGVVGIERPSGRQWSEDELVTIEAIAEQVALALDTARLARETERSAWRDQVVSEATAKVWSSDEIEEVMRAAVAQLGEKLRASEVVIRLGTEVELGQE